MININIYRKKPKGQYIKKLIIIVLSAFFLYPIPYTLTPTYATTDPLAVPNNRFGVHIISATQDESVPAASLVNSSKGDWGYITVLVESNDRKHDKWQAFFNDLRKKHLIPIVRLATAPEGNFWKLPYEGEEVAWADFLDNLNWPTKNRYVTIYNEPNQGQEWAGTVNPRTYAQILDKTITALKNKNPDFFVLNAGFDASAPNKPPLFKDELTFLQEMNKEVPGIFNKLDGWASHSYPNPGFAGSPDASGKGTVRTWEWELSTLQSLGVNKKLPVFITETGWKHAEGLDYDKSLPSADTVGEYLQKAFKEAWNNSQIIAVTPFLLNYQEAPFDHFSFKKLTGEPQNLKILGAQFPDYYPHYQSLLDLPKVVGQPAQKNESKLTKGLIYPSLVAGQTYTIPLTFKNTGQSIWNERGPVELRALEGGKELGIEPIKLLGDTKIEPGGEGTFYLKLKAPLSGVFNISLQLFNNNQPFDQNPIDFISEVKSPVVLTVNSSLLWKEDFSGEYILEIASDLTTSATRVNLDKNGKSEKFEAKYLLPDHNFIFTLHKPFYQPKTIQIKLQSGENLLSFGPLKPDFFSALFKPKDLWRLLPFSK